MPGLILDSSTDRLILALSGSPSPRYQIFAEAARIGSNLFSLVDAFLSQHLVVPQEFSYIAVGRGPGSYTGTRAAVAAATGFSLAADIPLIHFPSPLAFLPSALGKVAAILEIKGSKDVYALFYEEGSVEEKRASLSELSQKLSCQLAIASLSPSLELPKTVLHPLEFIADTAITRIASWVEKRNFTTSSAKEETLVYLQPQV